MVAKAEGRAAMRFRGWMHIHSRNHEMLMTQIDRWTVDKPILRPCAAVVFLSPH